MSARRGITPAMINALRVAPTPGEYNATMAIHRRGWTDVEGRLTQAGRDYLHGLERLAEGKISLHGFVRSFGPLPLLPGKPSR